MDPWINFQKDKNVKNCEAGFRKRLPGKPIYAIFVGNKQGKTRRTKINKSPA